MQEQPKKKIIIIKFNLTGNGSQAIQKEHITSKPETNNSMVVNISFWVVLALKRTGC